MRMKWMWFECGCGVVVVRVKWGWSRIDVFVSQLRVPAILMKCHNRIRFRTISWINTTKDARLTYFLFYLVLSRQAAHHSRAIAEVPRYLLKSNKHSLRGLISSPASVSVLSRTLFCLPETATSVGILCWSLLVIPSLSIVRFTGPKGHRKCERSSTFITV